MECFQALLLAEVPTRHVFRVALPSPEPGVGFDKEKFAADVAKSGYTLLAFGTTNELDKVEKDLKSVSYVHEV